MFKEELLQLHLQENAMQKNIHLHITTLEQNYLILRKTIVRSKEAAQAAKITKNYFFSLKKKKKKKS